MRSFLPGASMLMLLVGTASTALSQHHCSANWGLTVLLKSPTTQVLCLWKPCWEAGATGL